jgi:hypothetical protein
VGALDDGIAADGRPEVNDEQTYLFDLQGYLVLPQVVPPEGVAACNAALDRFEEMDEADYPAPLCLGQPRTPENLYISNIIEGDDAFLPLMDLPPVLDAVEQITGGPYRLNHTYTIYRWGGGFTGLHMHGTPIIPKCQYHCRGGQMVSTLTKVVFPLLDCGPEDGCFAVIPGAHKSNFPKPWGNHPEENPPLTPVPAKAGDAIIFTEALTHGSTVNTSGLPRRTLYYCYSIGYMPDWGGQHLVFSDGFAGRLSPERQELLRLK